MPDFDNPIDSLLAGEAAASLGISGRKLKKSLDSLRQYDANVAARTCSVAMVYVSICEGANCS